MTSERTQQEKDEATQQQVGVLQQYGLRWAVLAAWRDALQLRQVKVPADTDVVLETARMKIASGNANATYLEPEGWPSLPPPAATTTNWRPWTE